MLTKFRRKFNSIRRRGIEFHFSVEIVFYFIFIFYSNSTWRAIYLNHMTRFMCKFWKLLPIIFLFFSAFDIVCINKKWKSFAIRNESKIVLLENDYLNLNFNLKYARRFVMFCIYCLNSKCFRNWKGFGFLVGN